MLQIKRTIDFNIPKVVSFSPRWKIFSLEQDYLSANVFLNILGNHGDHVPLIISGGGHIRRGKAMCLRIRICPSLFDGSHPSSLLATGITLKVLLSLLGNEQFVNRLSLFYLSCYDRSI